MTPSTEPSAPIASASLQSYFHHSISRAVDHQRVEAGDATIHYLVNLLTHFSRSENLFDYSDEGIRLRPLAQIYADAVYSESATERRLMLRRMGDIALFVSGMFSGFFRRRRALVGMDYYIAMGGRAYGCLAADDDPRSDGMLIEDVFGRLSRGFAEFVQVLTEVGEEGARRRERELTDLFEGWAAAPVGRQSTHMAAEMATPPGWVAAPGSRLGRH